FCITNLAICLPGETSAAAFWSAGVVPAGPESRAAVIMAAQIGMGFPPEMVDGTENTVSTPCRVITYPTLSVRSKKGISHFTPPDTASAPEISPKCHEG